MLRNAYDQGTTDLHERNKEYEEGESYIRDKYQKILNSEQNDIDDYSLNDVIVKSSLISSDPQQQAINIIQAYNTRVVSDQRTFITSLFFGEWVQPDEFLLGACNSIPELTLYDGAMKIRRQWFLSPTVNSELLGRHKQTELMFGAYGSYVLNVPVNQYAKAWSGNIPILLGPGPHVVHDNNFKFKKELVNQSDYVISHGFINIIRVPAGKIAKVWVGSEPFLLESRKEPYVFTSPNFRLEAKSHDSYFFDATSELIVHGSIKRIMPHTGVVAIAYSGGNVQVIPPKPDGRPTIINSGLLEVGGFLDTNVQHFVFPSEENKEERIKSNPKASPEEVNNFVFTTKESLKITAKIFVAFGIKDPELTLKLLSTPQRMIQFIENTANVEMGKAIQSLSSQDFLNRSFQQAVHDSLSNILSSYGIVLTIFNVESPRVLDKDVEKKLSEAAMRVAEENSRDAVLVIKSRNDAAEADRLATTERIKQEQLNQAEVSKAQARLEAAKLDAAATIVKADAEVKADSMRAKLYTENAVIAELQKMKLVTEAINKSNFVPYIPQTIQHITNPSTYSSPFGFFGARSEDKNKSALTWEETSTPKKEKEKEKMEVSLGR